ncbi:hypothetical protein DBR43_31670 [Pedobacter sp. KBW06]|uniref:hypothetical protein n=1 Tax=Pedobacter sp. KBW06 TaxID=2153359 RepID=UPI000F5926DB|nr:hypothetical protein [Pedobacter sp. KBW06]RQO64840.1 hypothetical protein DBR43_31670 [Pedobacter sp. KBW06]
MLNISIDQPIKTVGHQYRILDKLLKKIPQAVLFGNSRQDICYQALRHFDFSPPINNDYHQIEKAAGKVLELLGLDQDYFNEYEKDNKSVIDRFMHHFLELKDLPGTHLAILKNKVSADLVTINEMIDKYEAIAFIQENRKARNQTELTQKEFYERCLAERNKIRQHLRYGLKKRALSKAGTFTTIGGIGFLLDAEFDRPYSLQWYQAEKYFDYQQIDTVTHRLLPIPIRIARELMRTYRRSKTEFYSELQEHRPINNVLLQLKASAEFLPFIPQQRNEIFKELIGLFNDSRFYGFYALGMTQIEGLFTDMCQLCSPGMENKSLPLKVAAIKPFAGVGISRLDYFNHHLPHLRNRFLHHGTDQTEEIENLCKDLIYDLEEVLTIFNKLELDVIKFLKTIRQRDIVSFNSLMDLTTYFKLFLSLKRKDQLKYFSVEIQSFHHVFIPGLLEEIIQEMADNYQKEMNEIVPVIDFLLNRNKSDFKNIKISEMGAKLIRIKKRMAANLERGLRDQIMNVFELCYFLSFWKKVLDPNAIEPSVKNEIELLSLKVKPEAKKLQMLVRISGAEQSYFK